LKAVGAGMESEIVEGVKKYVEPIKLKMRGFRGP